MNVNFSLDGNPYWVRELPTGETVTIEGRDIRREKTGLHAHVALLFGDQLLGHDTFNIGRSEERGRLGKAAHSLLPKLAQNAYSSDQVRHDLDIFCLWLQAQYEASQFKVCEFDPAEEPRAQTFPLYPYVLEGAGTAVYGPPGSGKSYLLQAMGICIANGISTLWRVETRPILHVNLERSRESMHLRDRALRGVFNIKGRSGIRYLHARGASLPAVARAIKRFTDAEPGAVVLLDSLSRTGLGKLVDDDTANKFTDTMNAIAPTWFAIGHTPYGNETKLFGSIHFQCGVDIEIRLSSEQRGSTLGLALTMTKANHQAKAQVSYLALEFSPDGLVGIRGAQAREFPELTSKGAMTTLERVKAYLLQVGEAGPTEIAEALHLDIANVSRLLNTDAFVLVRKEGRKRVYSSADESLASGE